MFRVTAHIVPLNPEIALAVWMGFTLYHRLWLSDPCLYNVSYRIVSHV